MIVGERTYRPSLPLRVGLWPMAALCVVASGILVVLAVRQHAVVALAVAALLLMPLLLAAAVAARAVTVTASGILDTTLWRRQRVPWSSVSHLDIRGRSFILFAGRTSICADWLDARCRQQLAQEIVQQAKLVEDTVKPPSRVLRRYIPRAVPIEFVPHHRRRTGQA